MFNRHKNKFIWLALVVVAIGLIVPTHFVVAATSGNDAGGGVITSLFGIDSVLNFCMFLISTVLLAIFHVVGFLLTLAAGLLNISLNLTLHIKDYIQNTTGVYVVWQTIRDVSGMFIIFALLYTSFRMILGLDQGMGKLIKDIIIAGILINFSFFLVGLMIDASNMVSLSIYSGIDPSAQSNSCAVGGSDFNNCSSAQMLNISGKPYQGGLSAIVMGSTNFTNIFASGWLNSDTKNNDVTNSFKIIFLQVVGIIIMIILGMSFIVAAAAFVVRLVLLIFILACSPIWFASWIFPGMKSLSDEFTTHLKSQLIFMPAYMFLLYTALQILISMKLGGNVSVDPTAPEATIVTTAISVFINAAFVVIIVNIPLIGAAKISGLSNTWITKAFSTMKSKTASFAGRGITYGGSLAASKLRTNPAVLSTVSKWSPEAARIVNNNLAKAGSRYDKNQARKIKEHEDTVKQIGTIDRSNYPSEAAATDAEKAAKKAQSTYLEGLDRPSIFTAFVNSPARRKVKYKLDTEVNKEKIVEEHEETKKQLEIHNAAADPAILEKMKENEQSLRSRLLTVSNNSEKEAELNKQIEEAEKKRAEVESLLKTKNLESIKDNIVTLEKQKIELDEKMRRIKKKDQDVARAALALDIQNLIPKKEALGPEQKPKT